MALILRTLLALALAFNGVLAPLAMSFGGHGAEHAHHAHHHGQAKAKCCTGADCHSGCAMLAALGASIEAQRPIAALAFTDGYIARAPAPAPETPLLRPPIS
jgi:hypothetical protein